MTELPLEDGHQPPAVRLREARRRRGLTQEEVAEKLELARTTIVAIEKGERRVQASELVAFAHLYGASLEELQREAPPPEPLGVQLRGGSPASRGPVERATSEIERLTDDYLELERICGSPMLHRYPPEYVTRGAPSTQVAEAIAQTERNRLGLGDGPLFDLRDLFEDEVGIRVYALQLPSEVAAMFAFTQRVGACIGFNRGHPFERQRWSLAHEYAHFLTSRRRGEVTLLRHSPRSSESERIAEDFAAAFLMPASGLTRRLQSSAAGRAEGPTAADLLQLAHTFGVSAQAMILRLEALRLIPSGTWDTLVDRGLRVGAARQLLDLAAREPDERLLPARFYYLAAEAHIRGEISEGQLARYLRMDRVAARRLVRSLTQAHEVDEHGRITTSAVDLSRQEA